MGRERVKSGGNYDFVYDGSPLKDTESTREFKEALRKHREQKRKGKTIHNIKEVFPNYHHKRKYNARKPYFKYFLLLLFFIALLLFIVYANQDVPSGTEITSKTVYANETLTNQSYSDVDLTDFIEKSDDYHKQEVNLIGFIESRMDGSGAVKIKNYYLVDSFNSAIKLSIKSSELSFLDKNYNDTYEVKGIYNKFNGGSISVESLKESPRIPNNTPYSVKRKETQNESVVTYEKRYALWLKSISSKSHSLINVSDLKKSSNSTLSKVKDVASNTFNEVTSTISDITEDINPDYGEVLTTNNVTKELESLIHDKINQQRKNTGLSALKWDEKLAHIARKHSLDMAKNNFFDHTNLKGEEPTDRANKAGYNCRKDFGSYYTYGIAENIFQNNLYDSVTYYNGVPSYDWNTIEQIATSTVQGWMDSPGHRDNILTKSYDKEGIGVIINSDDQVLITQNFC